MAKWEKLLKMLKHNSYGEASRKLDGIQDNDSLQDLLQVIPFKTLNSDLPESLGFLEKLYTKFISLTNDKEEGRLIIRHVFKVGGLLTNVIRTQVRDMILGRTNGPSVDSEVVDHITQITWNMDNSIIKELMLYLTQLRSSHARLTEPVSSNSGELGSELSNCSLELNNVVQKLNEMKHPANEKLDSDSWSNANCASCKNVIEKLKTVSFGNQATLDILKTCKEKMERCLMLFEVLKDLVSKDQTVLDVLTKLCVDIQCYGSKVRIQDVVEQYINSYTSILSSISSANELPSRNERRSNSIENNDRSIVNHGLRIELNASPFRRNSGARRLQARDKQERREPKRSLSCREPRHGESYQMKQLSTTNDTDTTKLKEALSMKEKQLEQTRTLVKTLRKREEQLLQKLTAQAKNNLMNSDRFENISNDAPRTENLVRQYDDLYSQLRLETLDELDTLASFEHLENSDSIKAQMTFAVITVSSQLAKCDVENRLQTVYTLLGIDSNRRECKSVENEVALQLRKVAATINLNHIVEEVFSGLCDTMFDFPELKSCDQLRRFVEACVRFSWTISAHVPQLYIEYQTTSYTQSVHNKAHTSNKDNDDIKYYIWPALIESNDVKSVLYKAMVVT